MDPHCREITSVILPAIRASIALKLKNEHGFTQQEIAKKLGIAQAAVNKYLKGNCSKKVSEMRTYIAKAGLSDPIVDEIANGASPEKISDSIDRLCAEKSLRAMAGAL